MDLETCITTEAALVTTAGESGLYETQEWRASVCNYLMKYKELVNLAEAIPEEMHVEEMIAFIRKVKEIVNETED